MYAVRLGKSTPRAIRWLLAAWSRVCIDIEFSLRGEEGQGRGGTPPMSSTHSDHPEAVTHTKIGTKFSVDQHMGGRKARCAQWLASAPRINGLPRKCAWGKRPRTRKRTTRASRAMSVHSHESKLARLQWRIAAQPPRNSLSSTLLFSKDTW